MIHYICRHCIHSSLHSYPLTEFSPQIFGWFWTNHFGSYLQQNLASVNGRHPFVIRGDASMSASWTGVVKFVCWSANSRFKDEILCLHSTSVCFWKCRILSCIVLLMLYSFETVTIFLEIKHIIKRLYKKISISNILKLPAFKLYFVFPALVPALSVVKFLPCFKRQIVVIEL